MKFYKLTTVVFAIVMITFCLSTNAGELTLSCCWRPVITKCAKGKCQDLSITLPPQTFRIDLAEKTAIDGINRFPAEVNEATISWNDKTNYDDGSYLTSRISVSRSTNVMTRSSKTIFPMYHAYDTSINSTADCTIAGNAY